MRFANADGFTLLEIVVVLFLLALTLVWSVPRFGRELTTAPDLRAARWILHTVERLKRAAVTDRQTYVLQIDVPANRLRVACESTPQTLPAGEGGIELQGGVSLLEVEYPGRTSPAEEADRIRFFPQGYSDWAVIHLALDGRRRFSFQVEPFLARARLLETESGSVH
jgi:prepilin-type N-terminal cleavage/methylation domain-containing protein